MEAAAEDEQLGQQLQSTNNYEELKSLTAEQGLDLGDLSAAEAQRTVGVVTGQITDELSDEELELVAGGGGDVQITNISMFKGFSLGFSKPE